MLSESRQSEDSAVEKRELGKSAHQSAPEWLGLSGSPSDPVAFL